jgi:hypothetical protein
VLICFSTCGSHQFQFRQMPSHPSSNIFSILRVQNFIEIILPCSASCSPRSRSVPALPPVRPSCQKTGHWLTNRLTSRNFLPIRRLLARNDPARMFFPTVTSQSMSHPSPRATRQTGFGSVNGDVSANPSGEGGSLRALPGQLFYSTQIPAPTSLCLAA